MMFERRQTKLSRCAAPRSRSWLGEKKNPSNAHVGGDEMDSEMFWEMEEKKEEGLKVSTKFFSVVSKFACSDVNSCTIRCCFREQITAAERQTFFFFLYDEPLLSSMNMM